MMTKKAFKKWFRSWEEGSFDFAEEIQGQMHRDSIEEAPEEIPHSWLNRPVGVLEKGETELFRRLYPVASVVLAAVMILFLFAAVAQLPAFGSADTPANSSRTILRYIEDGLTETGAVNIVAGVILDYRAFDTLGESHVLFTATVAVMILMMLPAELEEDKRHHLTLQNDIILGSTAKILVPFLLVFGMYIILNGHLGPGGGFSGGAVIGGGLILYATSHGNDRIRCFINTESYKRIVLCALLFYSIAKCYSFFCGANHIETFITPGVAGKILSAGLILPLNMAVGIVVACTMYGFYCLFTRGRI